MILSLMNIRIYIITYQYIITIFPKLFTYQSGVTPATGFLNGSEIAMNDGGYIMVDKVNIYIYI